MSANATLLVVDDEAVICQACQRVFSRQGFQVETNTDARAGLAEALSKDYSAVLLDIKMPEMDGIQFLEALRKEKPDVPVMIMTGYPSIPNAASAVRLGASDYITKPFTPELIIQSVQRMLKRNLNEQEKTDNAAATVDMKVPRLFFLDESWVQLEIDGSALVGATLRHPEKAVQELNLPEEGDILYQGLPLAGVTFEDGSQRIVPSPISGVVISVNKALADDPGALFEDSFGAGWIACICSTRLEDESDQLTPRVVVLVNTDAVTAAKQQEQLTALGCRVVVADGDDSAVEAAKSSQNHVFFFDADSLGSRGPELVREVRSLGEGKKMIVMAVSDYRWETAYRDQGIFYYTIEPFVDNEIIDVLNDAFRRQPPSTRRTEHSRHPIKPLHAIQSTNRNGHKVQLLASPGLLSRYEGLGAAIVEKVMKHYLPIAMKTVDTEITPNVVLDVAKTCDRVMVLLSKDMGRLPGSLVRDTKAEYVSAARENASRATTLVVQPDATGWGFTGFEDRTTEALAEHIVNEMISY
ncbi:MAG: response regulator [Pirellulales bacterium]|nr:response regulator [Pirellulales bacterium]